ncbi:MAG: hypothetical protein WEB04_08060 [Dehalococcoidia bacterium]
MPIAYACIIPPSPIAAARVSDATDLVLQELASQGAECALVIVAATGRGVSIGVGAESNDDLAREIVAEAKAATLPVDWAPRATVPEPLAGALGGARLVTVQTSSLSAREHFEFGRAVSRALERYEPKVAIVCIARLSTALGPGEPGRTFDARYQRAIEDWDVKWLAALDWNARRRVGEDAVAQTAVLMGALAGSRIERRVLAYEESEGAGAVVAAIDVLGPRRKARDV